MKPYTDEMKLLSRLRQGDQAAFEVLYHTYKRKLAGNLLRLLKSEELAEEALQSLFIKVWDHHAAIDPEQPFQAYLFRIAQNIAYDIFRRSARDKRLAEYLISASTELYSHIEENILNKESVALLQRTINRLPPQRRRVYTMFKIEGKSYKEISAVLNISHPTINEHIQKANQFLKKQLDPFSAITAALVASSLVSVIKL